MKRTVTTCDRCGAETASESEKGWMVFGGANVTLRYEFTRDGEDCSDLCATCVREMLIEAGQRFVRTVS